MSGRGGRLGPLVLVCVAAFGFAVAVSAEPFVPNDDAVVLERLPAATDRRIARARGLAQELATRPEDAALRVALAETFLDLARSEADPRFVGRAQGALGPLWTAGTLPPAARLARAAVRQAQHDFAGALVDIDALLAEQPDDLQALLEQATLRELRGDPTGAEASCARLARLHPGLLAQACLASARGLRGQAETSYAALAMALAREPEPDPPTYGWALTILGEIAARRGDLAAAERHFADVLRLRPWDVYVRSAYADLLLDADRAAEVLVLVGPELGRSDPLLLRRTLAATRLGTPEAEALRDELAPRFRAARLRGDETHLRDAARFALEIERNAPGALDLAARNWQRQRGPADARILLEAAQAAGDRDAAEPVLHWLDITGLEDVALGAWRRADGT